MGFGIDIDLLGAVVIGFRAVFWLVAAMAVVLIVGKAFLFFRGVFDSNAP